MCRARVSHFLADRLLIIFRARPMRNEGGVSVRTDRWTAAGPLQFIVASILLFGSASDSRSEELVIVDVGRTTYEIVVLEPAFPTTHLAARELQLYLARSTGVELPIVGTPTAGKDQIFIARSEGLAPHAFSIDNAGKEIWLRGRDSAGEQTSVDYLAPIYRGTCNAVYEFLAHFVGIRWFWSDELGEIIPKHERLALPADIHIREKPFFDYRVLAYGPVGSFRGAWARRNRLGAATTMHHSHNLHKILPTDKWAERGREDFAAMINGVRKPAAPGKSGGRHVCTSNADVVEIVARAAAELFERRPDRKMFSISPPDGSGMCQCPSCRALDIDGYRIPRGVRKGRPVLTDRILSFYNAVAERTATTHDDRLLGGYVYGDYLYPPRRVTSMHRNVALVVAPNLADDILDDSTWEVEQSIYRFWGGFHDRVYAHDTMYKIRDAYGLPAPLGHRVAELIRCLAESHIDGCYLYIGPTWEAFGPGAYLAARLLWNPAIDVDRAEDEYYRLLYKEAAGAVRAYFDVAKNCLKRATTCDYVEVEGLSKVFHRSKAYARDSLARLLIGYGSSLEPLEVHLRAAERLAAQDLTVRRRVERLRDNFTLTVTTCRGLQSVVDFERAATRDSTLLAPLAHAIAKRDALLERTGGSYAGALEDAIRKADENVLSPLEPGGYYSTIANASLHPGTSSGP